MTDTNKHHKFKLSKMDKKQSILYKIQYKLDEYFHMFSTKDSFYDNFARVTKNNYRESYNNSHDFLTLDYIEGLVWVFNYYLFNAKNNEYCYYYVKTPLLKDVIDDLNKKDYFEVFSKNKDKTRELSLFQHMIVITPNPHDLSKYMELTQKDRDYIDKLINKNKDFFVNIKKIDYSKYLDCSVSIFVNKCHFKLLDKKIPEF